MGVMGMVVVLLAQAQPLPGSSAPEPTPTPALAVPVETTLPASIEVRNDMGKRFKLVEARVVMDGQELSHRVAAKGQELEQQFRAYDGAVSPGSHQVTVNLVYEGRNTGIFTYLDDYKIRVQSSAEFTAQDRAHPVALQVLAYERSGITIPIEQKPTMEIKPSPGSPPLAGFKAATPLR
ncbi:MAG TPA: hypothetical protein VN914_20150 [Polyangia bacterium]|nr:hypothetical protein [Polyangia bacterium]